MQYHTVKNSSNLGESIPTAAVRKGFAETFEGDRHRGHAPANPRYAGAVVRRIPTAGWHADQPNLSSAPLEAPLFPGLWGDTGGVTGVTQIDDWFSNSTSTGP